MQYMLLIHVDEAAMPNASPDQTYQMAAAYNAYTDALKSKPGVWDWQSMSDWLKSPKGYAPGTKMTFAGLSKPEDRANIIAYLNQQSDSPLPLPTPPAASEAVAGAEASDAPAAAEKGENEPVLTEGQAAKQPEGRVMGEGAPPASGAKD